MPLYPRSSWVLRYESRFSDPILSKRRDDRPSAGPTSSAICGAPLVGPLLKSPPPIRTLPVDARRIACIGGAIAAKRPFAYGVRAGRSLAPDPELNRRNHRPLDSSRHFVRLEQRVNDYGRAKWRRAAKRKAWRIYAAPSPESRPIPGPFLRARL